MNGMKSLVSSVLWSATMEMTDFAGEVFGTGTEGRAGKTLEALLGQAVRVASCVTLGLEEPDLAERESLFEEARSALGALAARIHIAAGGGYVTPEFALGMRRRLKVVVDALDVERYRARKKALRKAAA